MTKLQLKRHTDTNDSQKYKWTKSTTEEELFTLVRSLIYINVELKKYFNNNSHKNLAYKVNWQVSCLASMPISHQ